MIRFFVLSIVLAAPAAAQVPNYRTEIEACVTRYPTAWACVNEERNCKIHWIVLCARDVNAKDPRIGLNGKRGDPNNISADVLAYRGAGRTVDVRLGGPLAIIDVVRASDSPQRAPDWNQHDIGPGTWVDPFSVLSHLGSGQPPPPPPPPPDPIARALQQIDEMHGWLKEIVTFVRALQGQHR